MLRTAAVTVSLAFALALAACGEAEKPAPPDADSVVAGLTPRATFEAMKRATLTRDWDALYELNAPSERRESEARWDEQKVDPAKEEMMAGLAKMLGLSLDELRALSLRDLFKLRNAKQAETNLEGVMQFAHQAEYGGIKEELADGVTVITIRMGDSDHAQPMKIEDGHWYLWKRLTAMSSF